MNIKTSYDDMCEKIKEIKPGDKNWYIQVNSVYIVPRAGLCINKDCPSGYTHMINEALKNKWIEPIAYMTESEYVWEELKT